METTATLYTKYLEHPQICTDTRKIAPGCLFFALKGDNFNGNSFASKALELGAAFVIIDEPESKLNENCLLVDDVLTALQKLAQHHRRKLKTKIIAITGSNGKTTSKELIASVLRKKFKTAATIGNLNNHIGVPLTLLSITHDQDFAIVEMGANHQGEIKLLCEIAEPDYGLITNVGKAHLEGFGGFEGVKKGKGELFRFLEVTEGTAFVNAGSEDLIMMSQHVINRVLYGAADDAYCDGELLEALPVIMMKWHCHVNGNSGEITAAFGGDYNYENILAAVTIGNYFGLEANEIKAGIESYVPSNMRSQVIHKNSNLIYLDAYNANPSSMKKAIDNFKKLHASKKIAIIGDMMELGEESPQEHLSVLNSLHQAGFEDVIAIGENFKAVGMDFKFHYFPKTSDASEYLKSRSFSEAAFLIKGSRKMALEVLVDCI